MRSDVRVSAQALPPALPQALARATAQADDYLARIPNTQYDRATLIKRFIEIERKRQAMSAQATSATTETQASNAELFQSETRETRETKWPHANLAHDPAYRKIVDGVDTYLAKRATWPAKDRAGLLSRLKLIEHQWFVHVQREAIKAKRPWRSTQTLGGQAAHAHRLSHRVKVSRRLATADRRRAPESV